MALSDYKTWYDEAMCASNEAGFAGVSAAQTIRDLDSDNARLTRERDQALARVVELTEAVRPVAEGFTAFSRDRYDGQCPEFCSRLGPKGEKIPNGVTVRVPLLRALVAALGETQ